MVNTKQIRRESSMRLDFLEELYKLPGGEKIKNCIQCGTCSGSCPSAWMMDYAPRKIFAMIRAGMRDEVLASETPWLCASCYTCAARCPQQIPITDIMYALKRLAIKEGKTPDGITANILSKEFVNIVNAYGRNYEIALLRNFFLKTNPIKGIDRVGVGLALFRTKRLPMKVHRINNIQQLRAIIKRAKEVEYA